MRVHFYELPGLLVSRFQDTLMVAMLHSSYAKAHQAMNAMLPVTSSASIISVCSVAEKFAETIHLHNLDDTSPTAYKLYLHLPLTPAYKIKLDGIGVHGGSVAN